VAVVGSGPAGLAAAAQLNRAGHWVTVFERADKIGGLLRYGIPDFKLDKSVVERRVEVMKKEGIEFRTNAHVGANIPVSELMDSFDSIVLCGGSTIPRDMNIPGRNLNGVHFAMDFLVGQNRHVAGLATHSAISAKGKNVVVIGGGDTGADCVGTSNRHEALSVMQFELMDKPPQNRTISNPWPEWPVILKTSSSHEEGCVREWSILTKEFLGDGKGNLRAIKTVKVQWETEEAGSTKMKMVEVPGSETEIPCELALLAIGFVHPQKEGMVEDLALALDSRGNVKAPGYRTGDPKIFAAGDMRRGQSLVVWAISEGREAARAVDAWLMGTTQLPSKSVSPVKVA
jgi:glutamate synthase (NADPH/NADH) small chain